MGRLDFDPHDLTQYCARTTVWQSDASGYKSKKYKTNAHLRKCCKIQWNCLSSSFFCVIHYELLYQTDVVYTIMQKSSILFSKDALNWSKVTVKTFKKRHKRFQFQINAFLLKRFQQKQSSTATVLNTVYHKGHVHTAAKFGCQFTFYSLIAFCTHTSH